MIKLLSFLLLTGLSTQAFASQVLKQCEQSRDTSISYLRCLDSKSNLLDSELTLWGNNILFVLQEKAKANGRTSALGLFKKSQKSFAQYVQHHCRWQYVILLPDPTSSAIKFKSCIVELTESRVNELKRIGKQAEFIIKDK